MIEYLICLLMLIVIVLATVAICQRYNFIRARHLLNKGGWLVIRQMEPSGVCYEWYYVCKDSRYSSIRRWSLADAYERQKELDRRNRLDLPPMED